MTSQSPPTGASHPSAQTAGTDAEGLQLIARVRETMQALLGVVESETELVRAGRLIEAAALEPQKSELASRYMGQTTQLKAQAAAIKQRLPQALDELRQQHNQFGALLQVNMIVLATAHAVSEGIIRGAASELMRKSAPETYGASGRAVAPAKRAAQPIALSRTY
jgi:hypothetical protein